MIRSLFAALAAVVALAGPALAQSATSSNRATVLGALGGSAIVESFTDYTNFDAGTYSYCAISGGTLNAQTNLASVGGSCTGVKPNTVLAGVTYSTPVGTGAFFNIDGYSSYFSGGFLDSATANAALTVTFDMPQLSFGFDTNAKMGSSFTVTVFFAGGGSQIITATGNSTNTLTGYGFTADGAPIVSAVITPGSGKVFAVDNFTFGPGVLVPEPGSLALLGGFLGLGMLLRRWKKDSSFS